MPIITMFEAESLATIASGDFSFVESFRFRDNGRIVITLVLFGLIVLAFALRAFSDLVNGLQF